MPWTLTGSAVVVIAQRFNPSAAGEHHLITHKVIASDEKKEGSLFTEMFVQVISEKFRMLILPEQLQFVPVVPREEEQELIVQRVGKLVQSLPVTPYKGVGLNFTWQYSPKNGDINQASRELFYVPNSPFYEAFGDANSRYGAYLSKDFSGFRLKLDIKPITIETDESADHCLQFGFNFHSELGEQSKDEQVVEKLKQWNDARTEVERIVDSIEKRV